MKSLIKYLVFFFIYFALHYIEGLPPIGGLSVAQLWKIPLIAYLLAYVLSTKRKFNNFERIGYAYSFEPYLCPAIATNPMSIITFSTKQLPLILFFNFWRRFNSSTLEKYLLIFAQFICLTSLVTLLGIVEPLKAYGLADSFMEDLEYYRSIYITVHAASSYFCISSIVIIYFLINNKFKNLIAKIFNLFLLGIAIYSLFLAYVRTGWLMFIISLLLIIDYRKINFKQKVKTITAAILIAVGLVFLYNTNEAFRLRISGGGQYRGESEQVIDTDGSGRLEFWETGITNWSKNDFYSLLFGKGYDAVLDDNQKVSGIRVFSHNQFVDSLAQYGLVSLILLIMYYTSIYIYIKKVGRISPYKKLCLSIMIASLIFSFFQNEICFDYAVIFSIALAIMYKTSNTEKRHLQNYNNLKEEGYAPKKQ